MKRQNRALNYLINFTWVTGLTCLILFGAISTPNNKQPVKDSIPAQTETARAIK